MAGRDDEGPVTLDARVVRTRKDVLGAALQVLHEDGADALTHARLAELAGYSKATVYKHWPSRADIIRDAFRYLGDLPHSTPTGDLRTDLIAEMTLFRDLMRDRALDRGLAVLADVAMQSQELAAVRDEIVGAGERVMRSVLAHRFTGADLEAAVHMLVGTTINSALLHGRIPRDDVIAAAVDLVL